MSLAWMPSNQTLYSGSTNGHIYAWDIRRKTNTTILKGHTDIVMNLLGLEKLNSIGKYIQMYRCMIYIIASSYTIVYKYIF